MTLAELLTYVDISHLKKIHLYYNLESNANSKNQLICSILRFLDKKNVIKTFKTLNEDENKFTHLLILDTTTFFTLEELSSKAETIYKEEEKQRQLLFSILKKGWLFPGYSQQTRNFYYIPEDLKHNLLWHILQPFKNRTNCLLKDPLSYLDHENLIFFDLYIFLSFVYRNIISLNQDGSIPKIKQKSLFKHFNVTEKCIDKGPRFGFGRRYHQYPDRFSLLYDYAYYKGYIEEGNDYLLKLTPKGKEFLEKNDKEEINEIYRFWLRLYKKPIPNLSIVLRLINYLILKDWFKLNVVFNVIKPWLNDFYYENKETLFLKIINMLVYLGILKFGEENNEKFIKFTSLGWKIFNKVNMLKESDLEEKFVSIF